MRKILAFFSTAFTCSWASLHAGNLDEEIVLLERFSSAYHIIRKNHINGLPSTNLSMPPLKGWLSPWMNIPSF